jgi:hypothetical protein
VSLIAGLDTEAREKILCLCRAWNPGRPVCSWTLLTQLSQFHYVCINRYNFKKLKCQNFAGVRKALGANIGHRL